MTNDSYTIKWTFANELDLVFVAIYFSFQKLLKVDDFLKLCKNEFLKMFGERIKLGISQLIVEPYNFDEQYIRITKYFFKSYKNQNSVPKQFNQTKQGRYHGNNKNNKKGGNNESNKSNNNDDNEGNETKNDDNISPGIKNFGRKRLKGPKGFKGKTKNGNKKGKKGKKGKETKSRVWDHGTGKKKKLTKAVMDEYAITQDILNSDDNSDSNYDDITGEVNLSESDYVSSDDDFSDLKESLNDSNNNNNDNTTKGGFWSSLTSLIGNNELTNNDLSKPLQYLEEQLTTKNVANSIAHDLCESVKQSLIGKKIGTFVSIKSFVKRSMTSALERILTQTNNINILYGIQTAREQNRPYTITFIGVNGVGKSTSLAKVINYFKSRNLKISVAACDTFRSGAVEQLRTHCKKFNVRLYEQGYARDAGSVAMAAIKEAKNKNDDVVLIDTAGRMQNNEPLMKSLVSLIQRNNPDLILFVGEALVGNDGINQIREFNNSLKKYSTINNPRLIDGIILTKFDTVDDKVGAAISMTYQSKKPIIFLGTGQGYGDLKRMHVRTLINKLLK